VKILSDTCRPECDTFATIGFFDGVHLGHQYLLEQLKMASATNGLLPLVVSFANRPSEFFHPEHSTPLLSPPEEKLTRFECVGIKHCLLLDFNAPIAKLTSKEFMTMLQQRYRVRQLLVGYNHHFGSDRRATFNDYRLFGQEVGIRVSACSERREGDFFVSSSSIRQLLDAGDISTANRLLGYKYQLVGSVVDGEKTGRTIGFPTANLCISPQKLIPKNGVYAVRVELKNRFYRGMLNIGMRPTVGGKQLSVEVHLLDFSGDLYGETLVVNLTARLRDEQKFDSLDTLKHQLQNDCDTVRREY
jgi:riboflavin kinase/FMN adenylyltransferase